MARKQPTTGPPDLTPGERLSPQVARRIRELILSGEVPGSAKLRTEHLAERFGVSATPVREALMSLHGEGLVDFRPGRGFIVTPITRRDLLDLYDTQAYLAGELTARAATRLTDQDIERLSLLQNELVAAIENVDRERAEAIEFELHHVINVGADSPMLQRLLKLTLRYVPFGAWTSLPGWSQAAPEDHLPLLRSLAHRSPLAARDAMTAHIRNVAVMLADLLGERGVLVQNDDEEAVFSRDARWVDGRRGKEDGVRA